ncbi:T9SS C-terminal target domain-containing protein [Microscilla marina]|uniref:Gliding motility-associated C-terminal domain-containing protein n=1 Tax=Microscilla marina ATCC 23134 TaxID=313606 RepID=A1ZC35_MICM2|nr:T9SS C-terminal target domain-containing protein [Microscilla marina]EAY31837.1 hypothetical protein M23134_01866 [Microscilla marina ATCC 23134]
MGRVLLEKLEDQNVPYTNPECSIGQLVTRKIIYGANLELSANVFDDARGYYVVWERCCRNNIITNINNPGGTGNVFYMEFPAVVRNATQFINSSPEFFTLKGDYACINQPFTFEFGAADPDGDQLRYSFVTPLAGNTDVNQPVLENSSFPAPYSNVSWQLGVNATNAIAPGMAIDANGRITVTPDKLGLFVFSVLCEEIRNGVVIGRVRRDFQILVIDCPTNQSPAVFVREKGEVNYYSSSDTIYIDLEKERCLDVFVRDPDFGQQISVSVNPINFQLRDAIFNNALQTNSNPNDSLSFDLCWPECLATDATNTPFIFDVIASDDGCVLPKRDTIRLTLIARRPANNPPNLSSNLTGNSTTVTVEDVIGFSLLGVDIDNDSLCIEAVGRGFDLAALGINFNPILGKGNISGDFSWTTSCVAVPDSVNEYMIDFIITEKLKCNSNQDTLTVKLIIKDKVVVLDQFLPANVFTPNNDGKNDVFKMPNLPNENCKYQFRQIDIFNRWGRRVFRSKDRNFEWSGGNAIPGIYYYHIDFKSVKYKGTVTLRK